MGIIKRMRKQEATWWEQDTPGEYGQETYKNPVKIKCRWEDVAETFATNTGDEAISKSVVYVDRVMKIGDILMLGHPSEIEFPNEPRKNKQAFEIRQFKKLPNLRNTETLYMAML